MDWRWLPINRDSKREWKLILHPTAAIWEVRRGLDPGSDDSIDLSEFVKEASQSAFELSFTLAFNRELFGPYQPKPNQVVEVQLWQANEWKPLWLGHIDAINSFTMQRGERQMQLIAKTRDQQDIWRNTPRMSPLFPQLTQLTYMAQRVARSAEMQGDEIVLPPSAIVTAHVNTQLADMTAWEMVTTIFQPMGWTPFIDGIGRLRAADRSLQARKSDIKLTDDRMVKVGGQRQRPPVNRVRVEWLDPGLKRWDQQRRLIKTVTVTIGWWLPFHNEPVKFSEDESLRVWDAKMKKIHGINTFLQVATDQFIQDSPSKGHIEFDNSVNTVAMATAIFNLKLAVKTRIDPVAGTIPVATSPSGSKDQLYAVQSLGFYPVSGIINQAGTSAGGTLMTVPGKLGSLKEAIAQGTFLGVLMNIGTGTYEIWGTPYDYVHAKNVSEAFDSSVPTWVNNVMDIRCDLIGNEEHAKAVAIRELIYSARAANKWSVTIVDDPRLEYGDILEFPDHSQLYVEEFTRTLTRGSEATLDVKGFLVGPVRGAGKSITVIGGLPGEGVGEPGGPGGGPTTPQGPSEPQGPLPPVPPSGNTQPPDPESGCWTRSGDYVDVLPFTPPVGKDRNYRRGNFQLKIPGFTNGFNDQDRSLLMTWELPVLSIADQTMGIDHYISLGLTHILLSIPQTKNYGGNLSQLVDTATRASAAGLYVVCAVLGGDGESFTNDVVPWLDALEGTLTELNVAWQIDATNKSDENGRPYTQVIPDITIQVSNYAKPRGLLVSQHWINGACALWPYPDFGISNRMEYGAWAADYVDCQYEQVDVDACIDDTQSAAAKVLEGLRGNTRLCVAEYEAQAQYDNPASGREPYALLKGYLMSCAAGGGRTVNGGYFNGALRPDGTVL